MEKSPPATASMTPLALASERMRKMPSRTSGWALRDSMTMKAASSATAPASRPRVRPESQP